MKDLKLAASGDYFDLELEGSDLAGEDGLDSAAILSMFTESAERGSRGYWGDALSTVPGDRWGSALRRSAGDKNTRAARVAMLASVERSLDWALEDGLAGGVAVESGAYAKGRLDLTVEIDGRGAGERWALYWDVQRGRVGIAADA